MLASKGGVSGHGGHSDGNKLKHRMGVRDLSTNTSYSISSGEWGRADVNFCTCTLAYPSGLLILNDTLQVGTDQKISSIKGE